MRKALSFVLAVLFCAALFSAVPAQADGDRFLEINEANFPDANFLSWIIGNLAVSGNGASGYYMTEAQVNAVTDIDCSEAGISSLVGIEHFTSLEVLDCYNNNLSTLDVSNNLKLNRLRCYQNNLTQLDVSANTELEKLRCQENNLTSLDVSKNTKLQMLDCYGNRLESLDVSVNTVLQRLFCENNHLRTLNVSKNTALAYFSADGQTVLDQEGDRTNGAYTFDMKKLMSTQQLQNVSFLPDSGITMNSAGIVTLPGETESFTYRYNASADQDDGDIELPELPSGSGPAAKDGEPHMMNVTVYPEFDALPAFDGTVEWNKSDVKFNGKTPYVIADGQPQTPRFTVKAKDGSVVDPSNYTYEYLENVNAGTAYVMITFTDTYSGTAQAWFKIYLPATDYTMVENRDDGIYMEWHAVEGAAGYVIYRRAWSSTTGGKWTDFVRWNNTTELNWTDKTVYAGTRYQYGIKAYFERRVDPVSGATIGGNVGDNYNLGIVGPLKTTVRITTRKLNSVTGGSKQLTVKWTGSSLFTGYEVQIATDAAFTKNVKTVKITNPKTYQTTIKSLKAKTTYYVRVRSYHLFEGMTYFGGWSNVLHAKTK